VGKEGEEREITRKKMNERDGVRERE